MSDEPQGRSPDFGSDADHPAHQHPASSGLAPASSAPSSGSGTGTTPPRADDESRGEPTNRRDATTPASGPASRSGWEKAMHFLREVAIVVVVALVASALLRAFVVQAFFVPSGSMLPEIQLHDRILVSRIGGIDRGEVVVFEDPGGWIPPAEQASPPSGLRKGLEWIGVLPASGHEHLVKRVIGLPGDHVVCCENGKLVINGVRVDESDFLRQGNRRADNYSFDVVVPAEHIFVLGDNRYVSGDSSRQIDCADPDAGFVPMDMVTGRAFAVIWPRDNIHLLKVPDAYDEIPEGQDPPPQHGVVNEAEQNPDQCAKKAS